MNTNPKNKLAVKSPKKQQTTGAVGSIIQEITAQCPSMTADEALACALKAYSQRTKKRRSATNPAQLHRKAVASLAKDIVIDYSGPTFTSSLDAVKPTQGRQRSSISLLASSPTFIEGGLIS
jgi:hypothetical protein